MKNIRKITTGQGDDYTAGCLLDYSYFKENIQKNINPQISSTNNGKLMILSRCAICNSKKSKFIKKQAKGLLSKLGIKTPLNKIPILGDILFSV